MGSVQHRAGRLHRTALRPLAALCLAGCGQVLGIEELQLLTRDAGMAGPQGSGGAGMPSGGGRDTDASTGGSPDGSTGVPPDGGMGDPQEMAGRPVNGTIVNEWGRVLPDVVVAIDGDTVLSDEEGRFTVEDVAARYDAELTIETDVVDGWVFEGLTRRDPVLQVYRGVPQHASSLELEIENLPPSLAGQELVVGFGSPDWEYSYSPGDDTSGDAISSSIGFLWRGPQDRSAGTAHALLWESVPDTDLPLTYLAYDAAPAVLGGDGPGRLDMSSDVIDMGTITGTLGPAGMDTPEVRVELRFADNARIPLISGVSAVDFTVPVPVLPDSELAVVGAADGVTVTVDPVMPGQTDLDLQFPSRPALIGPVSGAVGTPDQELRWRNEYPVSVVRIRANEALPTPSLYIVTAETSTRLRALSGSGFELPRDEVLTWVVVHHGDFVDVDAATGSDGLLSEGARRGSGFRVSSAERDLVIAGAADQDEPVPDCGNIKCDCTFEGIELWGDVEIVDSFGDFTVREVDSFPDLKVQEVAFPTACGEWRIVDSFGDFTVEVVDNFADFDIQYVDAFPGIP